MKLHMTDGHTQMTVHFDPHLDLKQYQAICASNRPVSLALRFALRRLNADVGLRSGDEGCIKMYPLEIDGAALHGLSSREKTTA